MSVCMLSDDPVGSPTGSFCLKVSSADRSSAVREMGT